MTGLWNPEGKGYERIPSAYGDFAISKKNEFFLGMLGSVLFAIVFTCFVADYRPGKGHSPLEDGQEASIWLGLVLGATLVVSYGVSLVSKLKR